MYASVTIAPSSPLPNWTGAATFDPIRTCTYFLTALPPAQRRKFLAEAERITREELAWFQESVHMKAEDAHERLASLGTFYELEGRLKWLGGGEEARLPDR